MYKFLLLVYERHALTCIDRVIHLSVSGFSYNRECHRQWKMKQSVQHTVGDTDHHWLWQEERCIGGGDHSQVESSLVTVSIFTAAKQYKMWQKEKDNILNCFKRSTTLCLWNNMFYILYFSSIFNISYVIVSFYFLLVAFDTFITQIPFKPF